MCGLACAVPHKARLTAMVRSSLMIRPGIPATGTGGASTVYPRPRYRVRQQAQSADNSGGDGIRGPC